MQQNYLIIRNSINNNLLNKTIIYDDNILVIDGSNKNYGKKLFEKIFITDKLQNRYEYLIFIDEDCILYKKEHIFNIIDYMEQNDIDIVGMPDGGEVSIRTHRPDVPNAFFLVIKSKKLKSFNTTNYNNHEVTIGENSDEFSYDNFEPYYKIFHYLINDLKMNYLPLKAKNIIDECSTELYFNDIPICLHTWYARKYNVDNYHTKRINNAIKIISEKYKLNESNNE